MKAIVWTNVDGRTWITHPAPNDRAPSETEPAWLARIIAKDVPSGAVNVRIVDRAELPPKDEFRNAMRNDLTFDMEQCRAIWRDKLRDARTSALAALDIELSQAFKDPAAQNAIEAKRQALRDITQLPAIDAAKTPAELKAVWPAGLTA